MYKIIRTIEASLQPLAHINKSPYITDVTTFPSITVLRPDTERLHTSSGAILKTMRTKIRGYVRDEHPTAKAELLARQIEYELQTIKTDVFDSIKVVSVMTDDGILRPYGMCELGIEVQWYEV